MSHQPKSYQLAAGTHYICCCGKSANMPHCDGSHQGTDFIPSQLELDAPKTVYLCGCGASKASPYCDGSHQG